MTFASFAGSDLVRGVQFTRELQRVVNLPRRIWTEESAGQLAKELTAAIRKPGGTMSLRPIQAQGLFELAELGGLFAPIRVGGGKTLLAALAAFVTGSRRPLLLTKANLIEKTKRENNELRKHWPAPNFLRMMSYELLGRVQSAGMLEQYAPDLIIPDEVHKLKNPKAAVTKRVKRYIEAHPDTKMAAMSGSITKRSLKDFAHILEWCLGAMKIPLPSNFRELEEWASALDEKTTEGSKMDPGALVLLIGDGPRTGDLVSDVRTAYGKRLVQTPGVVSSTEKGISCSLSIEAKEIAVRPTTDAAFELLRTAWTTPDDHWITDPLAYWRHARELALGFYYRWNPRPPDAWIEARKSWSRSMREILSNNRRELDSELQVTQAVDKGHYPSAEKALTDWRAIRGTFEPNTEAVWFDDSVLKACSVWAIQAPGIIWTEHTAFALELARLSRLDYYGKQGLNARGQPIEAHNPRESLIASIHSNGEGRNLQNWNRNLIVSCPPNGPQWEQVLGRTHRDGQEADEVTFDVIVTALEHVSAFYQAIADARFEQSITPQEQKLLYADIVFPDPDEIGGRKGFRWRK